MSINLDNKNKVKKRILTQCNYGQAIDTSLLYEELRREFKKTGAPVEVNFRSIVDWIKTGDRQTHYIHQYPAKLLPHIAHFFANSSTLCKKDSIVLDPFCGSGTVALEVSMANKIAYIADANPLARLITRVKTTPYACYLLRQQANEIFKKARRLKTAPVIPVLNSELWYSVQIKEKIEIIKRSINETASAETIDFFNVCFSSLTRKLSYADPSISVPVRLKEKDCFDTKTNAKIKEHMAWLNTADPISEYYKICELNIFRVENTNQLNPDRQPCKLVGFDARNLKDPSNFNNPAYSLPDNSIDLIVTSPPYGSAQKYIRSTSLSLNWLQLADVSNLRDLEYNSIGSENIRASRIPKSVLPDLIETQLSRIAKTNRSRSIITRTYLSELSDALNEIARVTNHNGYVVLIIGNNQVCGELLENDKFITSSLINKNFSLEISLIDNIKSRRLLTKRNKTASVITHEHILFFRKQ